mmetsp:Transcript_62489/g.135654  ORF Transcript_62489/g.135654 Transcript_62489/m.135654 type:complete len:121 (+) Transcript_62489:22-384(+)
MSSSFGFCLSGLVVLLAAGQAYSGNSSDFLVEGAVAEVSGSGVITALDWIIIVASLVGTLILGLWTASKNSGSSADYFVGSREMGWGVVGASMFASNIGTEHFVGQAGSAAAGGPAVGLY